MIIAVALVVLAALLRGCWIILGLPWKQGQQTPPRLCNWLPCEPLVVRYSTSIFRAVVFRPYLSLCFSFFKHSVSQIGWTLLYLYLYLYNNWAIQVGTNDVDSFSLSGRGKEAVLCSVSHSLPKPAFLCGWLADRCSVSQQLGALQTNTIDTIRPTTDTRYRHTLQTHFSSFLTQWTYFCSNFVAMSSLVLQLLKKCRVR